MPAHRVVVVGGGIAGLSFLAAFRENGRVDLLERASAPRSGNSGIVLHPNAVRALRAITDVEELSERSAVIERMVLHDSGTRTVVRLRDVWAPSDTRTLGINRATLHEILFREAAYDEHARSPAELVDVRSEPDGVGLRLADGDEITADLVVAADGVHSTVRSSLAVQSATATGFEYSRWLVPARVLPRAEWHVWRIGTTSIGGYPLGNGRTHVFLQRSSVDAAQQSAATVLAEHPFGSDALAAGALLVHEAPAFHLERHIWRVQRTVFIGDAAHALTPTMSEGGGLAIEDGVALAKALRQHGSAESALAAFERARLPRVAWAAKMGAFQLRTAHNGAQGSIGFATTKLLRAMYRPLAAAAPLIDAPSVDGSEERHRTGRRPLDLDRVRATA